MYTYLPPNEQAGAGGVTNEQDEELKAGIEATENAMVRSYKHMRTTNQMQSGENPLVERGLEGATWKFGTGDPDWTIDTGWAIENKGLLAATILVTLLSDTGLQMTGDTVKLV